MGRLSAAGWILFLALLGNCLWQYDREWTIGPLGLPKSLVAPDGLHYRNGEEIDGVTLAVIRSGKETEAWLGAGVVLALLFGWAILALVQYRRRRIQAEIQELKARMRKEGAQRPSGWPFC